MLQQSLSRLFLQLSEIPEDDRSDFERGLLGELLAIASVPPDGEESGPGPARLEGMAGELYIQLETIVLPQPTDVRRLRCDRADCPAKKLG